MSRMLEKKREKVMLGSCDSPVWSDDENDEALVALLDNCENELGKAERMKDSVPHNKGESLSAVLKTENVENSSVKRAVEEIKETNDTLSRNVACNNVQINNVQLEIDVEVKPKRLKKSLQNLFANCGTNESLPIHRQKTDSEDCYSSKSDGKLILKRCSFKAKNNQNSESLTNNNEHINDKGNAEVNAMFLDNAIKERIDDSEDNGKQCIKSNVNQTAEIKPPIQIFRPGYLWVSDLTRQSWCEQQLYYMFTIPLLVEEKPVMTEGTSLHLERELAVHDVVNIKVTSNEDIWAIKVLNMLTCLQTFLNNGTIAREIPIFGAPFGEDIFVVGLIDELRFDPDTFCIELWELKTRMRKTLPSKSQKRQHKLQVMLYKKLFDDLVQGNLEKSTVAKHLKLDLFKEFGSDVMQEIFNSCLSCMNLDELLGMLFDRMKCVVCIQGLGVEYVHQDSKQTIGVEREVYDENELEAVYRDYLKFWKGDRDPCGVEIEEAWKCQSCDFADICDWRQKKAKECSSRNRLK